MVTEDNNLSIHASLDLLTLACNLQDPEVARLSGQSFANAVANLTVEEALPFLQEHEFQIKERAKEGKKLSQKVQEKIEEAFRIGSDEQYVALIEEEAELVMPIEQVAELGKQMVEIFASSLPGDKEHMDAEVHFKS